MSISCMVGITGGLSPTKNTAFSSSNVSPISCVHARSFMLVHRLSFSSSVLLSLSELLSSWILDPSPVILWLSEASVSWSQISEGYSVFTVGMRMGDDPVTFDVEPAGKFSATSWTLGHLWYGLSGSQVSTGITTGTLISNQCAFLSSQNAVLSHYRVTMSDSGNYSYHDLIYMIDISRIVVIPHTKVCKITSSIQLRVISMLLWVISMSDSWNCPSHGLCHIIIPSHHEHCFAVS